jgi:hypothetical protein
MVITKTSLPLLAASDPAQRGRTSEESFRTNHSEENSKSGKSGTGLEGTFSLEFKDLIIADC